MLFLLRREKSLRRDKITHLLNDVWQLTPTHNEIIEFKNVRTIKKFSTALGACRRCCCSAAVTSS